MESKEIEIEEIEQVGKIFKKILEEYPELNFIIYQKRR